MYVCVYIYIYIYIYTHAKSLGASGVPRAARLSAELRRVAPLLALRLDQASPATGQTRDRRPRIKRVTPKVQPAVAGGGHQPSGRPLANPTARALWDVNLEERVQNLESGG